MLKRYRLQTLLEEVLGSRNVYFQPPSTLTMKYPCIVYGRTDNNTMFAQNKIYGKQQGYTITHITKDPDSPTNDKLLALEYIKFNTHFVKENLNHDVYTLYY